MESNLHVVPRPEDGDDKKRDDDKRSRFFFKFGSWIQLEIIGKVLEKPGALLGVGLILTSIVAVLLLMGDKLWRIFKP